ncbi:MAG TPA: PorV/PorQ family protein [Bacteroidales bacterium]|nr:PorV/PorQ family protein [Bacteroidales bacterium]HOL97247.1 PorV/PorQ family protein [Bacteroidales bacterium]HOM35539.1 PorV/PorQ family protein [Bacteroidales bacterium]HPD23840.1 PorV/PorQ family protein [Bacteroidales bacterium]HRS98764.1 PorV/PorQ family protein [Bacteroidales bacterium]
MKLKSKIIIFLILCYVWGFSQNAPKYSNEFLSIGVGGRAFAMGNSVIASAKDISGVYWNPALLTGLDKQMEIGGMHAEYFAGIAKYDFLGVSYRLDDKSVAGFSMIRFGVDDIPNTLDLIDSDGNIRYDRISSFSVADYAFLFSYSRLMPIDGLSIGGNAKVIRRIVGNFADAWGFGIDAAASYKMKNLYLGVNLRDVFGTFNAWSFNREMFEDVFIETGNEIPENGLEITLPRLLLGSGYKVNLDKNFSVYPEIGVIVTTDGKRNTLLKSNLFSADPSFGIEFSYNDMIFVRGGINNFQQIPEFNNTTSFSWQPNIGLGIKLYGFNLDYAYTDIGNKSIALYSHIFSLSYRFDTKNFFKQSESLN